MSAIGSVIEKAVDISTGSSSGTSLKDFLSKFSPSDGAWASTIDPLATFDLTMKLYPAPAPAKEKLKLEKLGDALVSAGKSAVKNLANNLTGGLVSALFGNKVEINKLHNQFAYAHKETFLEYLVPANLIVGSDDFVGENAGQTVRPLELQLGLYCQEVTVPNLEIPGIGQSTVNQFGEFPLNGLFVKPDTNVLTLKILNTRVPLHERIFYPWMREVTLPFWSYDTQPYTTATITIDYTKHADIKYVFYGCRPSKIVTMQAHQAKNSVNLTRDVSFIFDFMTVTSKLKTAEDLKNKLLSTGKTLFNAAAKMAKL